jgi:hypothetical protein
VIPINDLGKSARAEQDARWRANEPKRRIRAAKVDRAIFWLFIGLPGICILAAILGPIAASIGLVPFLLLVLIVQNSVRS